MVPVFASTTSVHKSRRPAERHAGPGGPLPRRAAKGYGHRTIRALSACAVAVIVLRTCWSKKDTLFANIRLLRPFRPLPQTSLRDCALRAVPDAGPEDPVSRLAVFAGSAYADSLLVDPVMTKMYTAAFVVGLGDAVSQFADARVTGAEYDTRRGLAFAIFGAMYTGLFQHWWFEMLNENLNVGPGADFSESFLVALSKTVLCQFGTIPLVYIPLFFALTGLLRGLTLEKSWERASSLYLPLLRRNVTFWIPVQMVQFLYVDPEWQVPYVCVAGFVWSILLSSLTGPIKEADNSADLAAPRVEPIVSSK